MTNSISDINSYIRNYLESFYSKSTTSTTSTTSSTLLTSTTTSGSTSTTSTTSLKTQLLQAKQSLQLEAIDLMTGGSSSSDGWSSYFSDSVSISAKAQQMLDAELNR